MKVNKLKQCFVLQKSLDYLSTLHELRGVGHKSRSLSSKLAEIDSFLLNCLESSEYYDYLNSNLDLDLRLFRNFSDKNILKELLNRAHREGDIFLYVDANIYQRGNPKDVRITIYRKLLERLALRFLEPQDVYRILMSEEHRKFLVSRIKLHVLKDYKSLSLAEIPPYKIWNKKTKKMMHFKSIPIDQEVSKLERVISGYQQRRKTMTTQKRRFLEDFNKSWWVQYKRVITGKYRDIASHFRYFEGIKIKVAIAKTFLRLPVGFPQSDLALCMGKRRSKSGTGVVKVDENICPIFFWGDYFGESYDLSLLFGFDFNVYRNDFDKIIQSSIELDVREELLNLFKVYFDDVIFEIFSNKVLSLIGMHIEESKQQAVQYGPSFRRKAYEIARFTKSDKINAEIIEKHRQPGKETIVLASSLIPDTIKIKYREDGDVHLKDIDDLLSLIRTHPANDSQIIHQVIYPFLRDKLRHKKIDLRLYNAQQLITSLGQCPKGIKGWRTFEDVCIELIDFAFRDSFRSFRTKVQSRNYDGLDIRDEIIQNTGKGDFWKEVRADYEAKNIVFEFKNLAKELAKDDLIQMSDYLKKEALGRLGIIFSRKGPSKGAAREQRSLLVHDKKLILVLNESDLCDLVNKRLVNEEPEEILETLKFDLETSL